MSAPDVAARLAAVRARIEAAAARAGRPAHSVQLVGVSKQQPVSAMVDAVAAGLDCIGESYAQEALTKLPELRARLEAEGLPLPELRFIGRLQRNKAGVAAEHFDAVDSLDRASLGEALERRAAATGRPLEVLVQVDLSSEASKGGCPPEQLPELLAAAGDWPHLRLRGLMAIPAAGATAEAVRPAFARLRELRDNLCQTPEGAGLERLSMGMTGDFEIAIEEGATHVRVGTALFGPRPMRKE